MDIKRAEELKTLAAQYSVDLLKKLHTADGEYRLNELEYRSFLMEVVANLAAGAVRTVAGDKADEEQAYQLMTVVYRRTANMLRDMVLEMGGGVIRIETHKEGG